MSIALWAALVVFLSGLIVLAINSRKRVWYMVYLANPEMSELHVYRSGWDKFWHGDEAGIMMFHDKQGKSIRVSKHWIIKIVEE